MKGCGNKIGPYDCCTIITGDAKKLALAIPDESVDLIFTDPVYDRIQDYEWLAKIGSRVLYGGGSCLALTGGYYFEQVFDLMRKYLDFYWLNAFYMMNVASVGTIWPKKIGVRWKPVLWFVKGQRESYRFVHDGVSTTVTDKRYHRFGQASQWAWYWLDHLTRDDPDMVIWDPFCGGGTVPAVCKMLGRHYLAFEIDPEVAERARERVKNTQPPLFVMEPEQAAMELEHAT